MLKRLSELAAARPVVHLDRRRKARMIEVIVADYLKREVRDQRVLDIGCGNGDISEYFAQHNQVSSVDVSDRRRNPSAAYTFRLVDSERLPFDEASFDLVLSHYVIEHLDDHRLHLEEIRRVLTPAGICYLATPNRGSPLMKGHVGNERVLRYREMAPLFERHGFRVYEYAPEIVTRPIDFHSELRATRYLPRRIAYWLRFWYPSQMFVLAPRA